MRGDTHEVKPGAEPIESTVRRELDTKVIIGWGRNFFSKSIAHGLDVIGVIRARNLGVSDVLAVVCSRARARIAGKLISLELLTAAKFVSPRISRPEIIRSAEPLTDTQQFNNSLALQGARIALIGPGFKGTDTAYLSTYDIIARIGFTGPASVANPEFSRCDLSFLAPWHARKLLDNADRRGLEHEAATFFLREDVEDEMFSALSQRFNIQRFSTTSCNQIFKGVTPNFGPQIIIWLLSQSPSNLHLSHIDLMTDPRRPTGYATNKSVIDIESAWHHEKETIRRSFAQFHNPYTHFSFFESLVEIPSISYSPTLKLIIDQGIDAYSHKLRNLYFE